MFLYFTIFYKPYPPSKAVCPIALPDWLSRDVWHEIGSYRQGSISLPTFADRNNSKYNSALEK
jgi:hypothetical protein